MLCFADYDPVTGPPTVDGYTGIHDDLVITSESDAGYVLGSRLTYDNGSGYPPVIFQGVKNGSYLNFAFFTRFDLSFDRQDVIVIALKPLRTSTQDLARRIDIFPVYEGVGTDEKNAVGGPAGTPDDTPPGVPMLTNYYIRTNHAAQNVVHYRGQAAGNPWTTQNPDMSPYSPGNVTIKTRSWQPPVPTLTSSVGAQTLPAATFIVADTSAFPSAGLFVTGGQVVKYTGKTGSSFTGCTGGGGAIPDSSGVAIPEVAWSIEVQVPLTAALGGTSWINIQDSFGLYFDVIRLGKTPASGSTGSQGWYSTQYLFPAGSGHYLTGNLNETTAIDPAWYGTGLIPALQIPAGSNLGLGVSFVNGAMGVGVRNTNDAAGSALGSTIRGASDPTAGDNRLVAHVQNTGPAAVNNIKAEFRFANWGLGPAGYPSWALASGASADQPAGVTVPSGAGGNTEITWTWPKASVPAAYAPPHQHQCMWVQLTDSGVNFTQSSVRRNMDFVNLTEDTRPATVSGVGYPVPAGGSHDFLLITHVRKFVPGKRDSNLGMLAAPKGMMTAGDVVYWLWIVEGYRRTGKTITIDGTDFEILDETPGAFGSIAVHQGSSDVFTSELSGGGIKFLGGSFHALKVPHNGSVEIKTRLAAGPAGAKPKPCADNPNDPWWLRLLKAICRFIMKLLGK
jgi:hypothetical protein